VGKTVTEATRQAVKAEAAARARLPADGRGLVVIMAEIGRGGMNQAIIEIEQTRTLLGDAIEAATPSPNP
jgi:stage V sporulation protein SpoVS